MSKVIELTKPFKKVFKINLQEPNTDNNVFRLHSRASVLVLMVCASLIGWKEYIGDPIQCVSEEKMPKEVLNTYCWIFPTYTLPHRNLDRVGLDVAQPGVGPPAVGEQLKYHKYYQWVCIVLFLQGLLFKIPHLLWKICEKDRMKSLIKDLDQPIITEAAKKERKQLLLDYLIRSLGKQNFYFYRFAFCEILNFVNVVGQIYFMDLFLDGDFINYGTQVMDCTGTDSDECSNPMSRIFPKVSKCDFFKYGPSGGIQKYDALCVLAINIVSEKVYVLLWFWFMGVATVTGLMMIYRALVVISVKVRAYLLYSRAQYVSFYSVSYICQKGNIGDWFILYQISRNIDNQVFVELLDELRESLENPTKTKAFQLATAELQPLPAKRMVLASGNGHTLPVEESSECQRCNNGHVLNKPIQVEQTQLVYAV